MSDSTDQLFPAVTIVVVSYNGRRFLDRCFGALAQLDYPQQQHEVILVDNGSSDHSVEYVRAHHPSVRIIVSDTNRGFAGGNNLGIAASKTPYIVTLNNDTEVQPGWLRALVETAEKDADIGICTSKLILMNDRLPLTLQRTENASTPLELRQHVLIDGHLDSLDILDGLTANKSGPDDALCLADHAVIGLPIQHDKAPRIARLWLAGKGPSVEISAGSQHLSTIELTRDGAWIDIPLNEQALAHRRAVVQNAGSVVFSNGMARDRGAHVSAGYDYFEDDRGQLDQPLDVLAACGASMLLRRTMLSQIGLFDERFFMYYEDVDLSWRARLAGWRIRYVPTSVCRHVHCGSSGEWSPRFTFLVERNRLLMLLKLATCRRVIHGWTGSAARTALITLAEVSAPARGRRPRLRSVWLRAKIWASLLRHTPSILASRRSVRVATGVSRSIVEQTLRPPRPAAPFPRS